MSFNAPRFLCALFALFEVFIPDLLNFSFSPLHVLIILLSDYSRLSLLPVRMSVYCSRAAGRNGQELDSGTLKTPQEAPRWADLDYNSVHIQAQALKMSRMDSTGHHS